VQYPDGTANFMYLIGSQADGTLGWAAVQVADLQTAPLVIQTGDGSTERPDGAPMLAIMALAAVVLTAGGVGRWALLRRD
jgi:hypothetical protein